MQDKRFFGEYDLSKDRKVILDTAAPKKQNDDSFMAKANKKLSSFFGLGQKQANGQQEPAAKTEMPKQKTTKGPVSVPKVSSSPKPAMNGKSSNAISGSTISLSNTDPLGYVGDDSVRLLNLGGV